MKVGLMLPCMKSFEINEAIAEAAPAMGVDSLWVPDHLLGIAHPALWPDYGPSALIEDPDSWLDPFCLAAALGRKTSLSLGTCVTDGTRRRGADLARTVLTLNSSCGGGFILGIGAGEAESLLPFGYDFSRPVGQLETTLKELRSLLDTGHMPGPGIGRTGLALSGPSGPPKVWLAGARERTLKLTGLYGDGWLPTGINATEFAEKLTYLNAVAASVDRPPLCASLFPLVLLGDSKRQISETLDREPLTKLILIFAPASLWARYGLQHPSGPDCRGTPDAVPHSVDPGHLRTLAEQIPIEMMEEWVFIGNADELAGQLRPYAEAGLEHIVLADITGLSYRPEEAQRLMASQMPHLIQKLKAMPIMRPARQNLSAWMSA